MKTFLFSFAITVGLIILIGISTPAAEKAKKNAAKAKAINNMRQIGMALDEFRQEHGAYPYLNSGADLDPAYLKNQRNDSNYLLGQLIVSGLLDSEEIFTAPADYPDIGNTDNVFEPLNKILTAGECDMIYVSQINGKPIGFGETFPSTVPILMIHLDPETKRFDTKIYNGKALYMTIDASVKEVRLDRKGFTRKPVLLPEHGDSVWGNQKPTLHFPLKAD